MDGLREGIQVVAPDGTYLYLNRAAAGHGRKTPEDLVGRRMQDCYPGIDTTPMYRLLMTCMVERTSDRMLSQFAFEDGSCSWFELRFQPVPQGLVILSIDVTEQHLLEEERERERRFASLGRLAGGVAHDFNNLLTVFTSSAAFIESEAPPDSPILSDTAQIRDAAARGARLTGQLLDFLKARSPGRSRADPVPVVDRVLDLLQRILGGSIHLDRRLGTGVPASLIETAALEQITMNLVLNARDALAGVGTIRIEVQHSFEAARGTRIATPDTGWVVLRVSDSGPGIAPHVLAHLFEPFYSTKPMLGGTGLGLASCRGLVDQVGGHIYVETGPDMGTTFTVYLPATTERAHTQPPRPAPRGLHGTETVLLVEDDVTVLALAARSLDRLGYRVHTARTAHEAERILRRGGVALLVTSLVLADGTGPELATHALGEIPNLRVLFMTGYADRTLLDRVAPELLLEKPFDPDQLADRVRYSLDLGRMTPAA